MSRFKRRVAGWNTSGKKARREACARCWIFGKKFRNTRAGTRIRGGGVDGASLPLSRMKARAQAAKARNVQRRNWTLDALIGRFWEGERTPPAYRRAQSDKGRLKADAQARKKQPADDACPQAVLAGAFTSRRTRLPCAIRPSRSCRRRRNRPWAARSRRSGRYPARRRT